MILRLLYKLFPRQINRLVFDSQRKPANFDKCELAFVDSNGKKYYRFMSDLEMSIHRKSMIELKLRELSMALDGDEMRLLCTAMEKALEKRDKQGRINPDIATLGFLIKEVRNRSENLVHPDLMMSMMCYTLIREDENPNKVDEDIHNQKVEQLTKDSREGLADFFEATALRAFIPSFATSSRDLELLMRIQQARVEAFRMNLINYITDVQSVSS